MINELLNKKAYTKLDILQKERILLEMFHSTNFYNIPNNELLLLLSEFEKIEAEKQNRKSFTVTSIYPKEEVFDSAIHFNKKEMYFNTYLLTESLSETYNKKEETSTFEKINFLNIFLLDCILHEQFHIIMNNTLTNNTAQYYKESLEYLIYISNAIKNDKNINNQKLLKDGFYQYIMTPTEFYAFLYAELNIKLIFNNLEKKYGKDDNIELYLKYQNKKKQDAIISYYLNTGIEINYPELYKKLISEELKEFSNSSNISYEQIKAEIRHTNSLVRKWKINSIGNSKPTKELLYQ